VEQTIQGNHIMKKLVTTIQSVLPDVIKEVNKIRIPALEKAWGRSFAEEMKNEDQVTVEIAKNYARVLNNTFYRHIQQKIKSFKEHTTNGSDYIFQNIPIEDKNSFSPDSIGWVGNGFNKTPIHLLKKFRVDKNGRIIEAFIALVDISKVNKGWSERKINTNRSTIDFSLEDFDIITVIYGELKKNKKKLKPITQRI
jgi:hypothetical protein